MRANPTVTLSLILAVVAVNATSQTNPWELSQPGAKLLMGVDVKSLRQSPVGQSIREQMNKIAASEAQSPLQGPMQAIALGLLDQIDRVFVSSTASPTAKGAAGAKTNPPFLLVVEGRIPMGELQPFLKGTPRRYRDADVYRTTQTDTTSLAFMRGEADNSTLLLGDEKSVLAAIVRRGAVLAPPSALLLRAQTLASTHDFWLIAEGPLSGFQPTSAAGNSLASKMAAQMKGIDMGLALRDGFQFELGVAAESDAVAAQMTQVVSTQIQMMLLTQVNRPETAAFANKLHISAEGNRMQIRLALTKDEFEQQLKAAQAARMQASTTSQAVRPADPGHITIYGLDDGPRVIQTRH